MGCIKHNAIIVTGWKLEGVKAAHDKAMSMGCSTSEIINSPVNSYYTFLVAPDGSKEGWDDSDLGDENRDALISWMDEHVDFYLDVVEVRYGGDDPDQSRVVRHSEQEDED